MGASKLSWDHMGPTHETLLWDPSIGQLRDIILRFHLVHLTYLYKFNQVMGTTTNEYIWI